MKKKKRLNICLAGSIILCIFLILATIATISIIAGYFGVYPNIGDIKTDWLFWLVTTLITILSLSVIFWIGIIMVYLSSQQLGIKVRVLGIVFGLIPIANLVMLGKIIRISFSEAVFEKRKIKLNEKRKDLKICNTRYPILMVHGVFFRDFEHFNYWGRIPDELTYNGATVFYGNHNSAAAVMDSAKELAQRIKEIVQETNCGKINVIAHSKGGLDMRAAIATTDIAPYIASLTTINTPHRGCEFANYLLHKIPKKQQLVVADSYNKAAAKLGDTNPDFLSAVNDLTSESCNEFNTKIFNAPNVYYQSVGSKLNRSTSGRFPLNFTYHLVKLFDGSNDGLVGENSFPWGSDFKMLNTRKARGISHGDMIDLNRENIKDFDVREFYVQLVAHLKSKGF